VKKSDFLKLRKEFEKRTSDSPFLSPSQYRKLMLDLKFLCPHVCTICEDLYEALDKSDEDDISRHEFLLGLSVFTEGGVDSKVAVWFKIFDTNQGFFFFTSFHFSLTIFLDGHIESRDVVKLLITLWKLMSFKNERSKEFDGR